MSDYLIVYSTTSVLNVLCRDWLEEATKGDNFALSAQKSLLFSIPVTRASLCVSEILDTFQMFNIDQGEKKLV